MFLAHTGISETQTQDGSVPKSVIIAKHGVTQPVGVYLAIQDMDHL